MRAGNAETGAGLELRQLVTVAELRPLEELQRVVWGVDDIEVVPATAMVAAVHAGGVVVGALAGDEVVGFAYGFVATPHGRGMSGIGLHSHMAAVAPEHRGRGVGRALKRYQAAWCREHGLDWISWTFDPLRPENARFNLGILGARGLDYLIDVYGPMPGTLGGGIASDRLLVVWQVMDRPEGSTPPVEPVTPPDDAASLGSQSNEVARDAVARDAAVRNAVVRNAVWLLPSLDGEAQPGTPNDLSALLAGDAEYLLVASPGRPDDVFADAALGIAWRKAHRASLGTALGAGLVVTGFQNGAYVLAR